MPLSGATLYCTAQAGIGASDWGLDNTGASTNAATIAAFATSTAVRWIQFQPGVSNTTQYSTSVPGTTATGIGWNVLVADSDLPAVDPDSPARPMGKPGYRIMKAGTWTYHYCFTTGTADTSSNFLISGRLYKKSGGTYTYIASVETAAQTATGLATNADQTFTVGSDVIFEDGETLHIEFFMKGRGGGATGLLAQNVTFTLTAQSSTNSNYVTIASPGWTYGYRRTLAAASGGSTLAMQRSITLVPKTVTAVGVAAMARKITAARVFATTAVGSAAMSRIVTVARSFSVTGTGVAVRGNHLIKLADIRLQTIGVGTAAYSKVIMKNIAVTAVGVTGLAKVMKKTVAVIGIGVAGFARRVTAVRGYATTASSTVKLRLDIPQVALNRIVGGGGTTVIKKVIQAIFDD